MFIFIVLIKSAIGWTQGQQVCREAIQEREEKSREGQKKEKALLKRKAKNVRATHSSCRRMVAALAPLIHSLSRDIEDECIKKIPTIIKKNAVSALAECNKIDKLPQSYWAMKPQL